MSVPPRFCAAPAEEDELPDAELPPHAASEPLSPTAAALADATRMKSRRVVSDTSLSFVQVR
jgi:hypothetical protein